MVNKHVELISKQLNLKEEFVRNTIELLENGATIPFISRYRKELTGSMDEVAVAAIKNLLDKYVEIDKRREVIINSIEEQEKMTAELQKKLNETYILSELEDIYLPFKPKRKTRASIARENGLEPLGAIIFKQQEQNLYEKLNIFLNDKIKSGEEALQGARDIIAEWVCENLRARNAIRRLFAQDAFIYSKIVKGREPDGIKYGDYYDFKESLKKCPSHRYLAMRRGEEEGFLKLKIEPDEDKSIEILSEILAIGVAGCGRL